MDKEKTDDFSGRGDNSASLESQNVGSLVFFPVTDNSLEKKKKRREEISVLKKKKKKKKR